jgi:hypothetical protein
MRNLLDHSLRSKESLVPLHKLVQPIRVVMRMDGEDSLEIHILFEIVNGHVRAQFALHDRYQRHRQG